MLTPIELQNTVLKSGVGYSKKDTDAFLEAIYRDYERLYKENVELKDKLSVLSDGIQYYKNMETTLQKALVLAEKASEDTQAVAVKKASAIEKEAQAKAQFILADAKNELGRMQAQTVSLVHEYEKYKAQFKSLANAQLELLDSECFRLQRATYDTELQATKEEAPTPTSQDPTYDQDYNFYQEPDQENNQYESAPLECEISLAEEGNNPEEEQEAFGQENMERLNDFEFLDDND